MENMPETKTYTSGDEQLLEYFKLVKLLVKLKEFKKNERAITDKISENPNDQEKQEKNHLAQVKELSDIYSSIALQKESIRLSTEATLRDTKVRLPLEIMRRRYKLNDTEMLIFCVLAMDNVDPVGVPTECVALLHLVSEGEYGKILKNTLLFDAKAPLSRNELIEFQDRSFKTKNVCLGDKVEKFIYPAYDGKNVSSGVSNSTALLSPQEIHLRLSKVVIGQEKAKRMIAVAAHAHLKRISANKSELKPGKSNIMLIGPTGSGKTLLARTLAEIIDVPMIIVDATEYTEKGYVGGDVDDMIEQLYNAARGDRSKAEKGIIFIDEIDKIASRDQGGQHNSNRDVSGKSVQEELLRFLDGANITVSPNRGSSRQIDMSNVLFIAGGAFPGMRNNSSPTTQAIGFGVSGDYSCARSRVHSELSNDLVNYGMIPEFVGRFPILVELSELNKNELLDIIKKPANSLLTQYRSLYGGISFSDDALEFIVEQSIKRKVGARGLRAILEETLSPIFFERTIDEKTIELTLTKEDLLKRA